MIDFRVAELNVVGPVLRYTWECYTFGVHSIVDCGERGYAVIDDRGCVVGIGDYPLVAQLDTRYNINVYLAKYAPYVEEYEIEYDNAEQFSNI
jgi:hypothetical protein